MDADAAPDADRRRPHRRPVPRLNDNGGFDGRQCRRSGALPEPGGPRGQAQMLEEHAVRDQRQRFALFGFG